MPQPTSTHRRKHITTARARDDDMWDGRDEEPLAGGGRDGAWQPSTRHHPGPFAQLSPAAVAAGATSAFAVIAWALSTSTAAGSNTEQLNWLLANPWGSSRRPLRGFLRLFDLDLVSGSQRARRRRVDGDHDDHGVARRVPVLPKLPAKVQRRLGVVLHGREGARVVADDASLNFFVAW